MRKEVAQCTEEDEEVFRIEDQIKGLAVAKSVLNRLQYMDNVLEKKIVAFQGGLRAEKVAGMRQKSIN